MGTVSICSVARSVYSGADSVYSGMLEVRMSVLLSGALCSTGAASSALTGEEILHTQFLIALLRSLGRWVAGSVLIEYSRARRRSKAMNGDAPPVFAAVARQLRISAQIIFFPAQGGGGARKGGAGLR